MKEIHTYISGCKENYCEDWLYADEKMAFVLDGASGVSGDKITDRATDVVWFVENIGQELRKGLHREDDVLKIIKNTVEIVAERYMQFAGSAEVADKPSTTLSLLRIRGEYLEYYSICDSEIVIRKKDGSVLHILDDRLTKLDNINFDRMRKIANEKGITLRAAFPYIKEYILYNRAQMNKPNGYAAIAHTTDGLESGLYGKVRLEEVQDALLYTDGFAEAYDLFRIYPSPAALLEEVSTKGIRAVLDNLFAAQEKDADCNRYARNKKRDDISAIYIKF